MAGNSIGKLFCLTTFGESHGAAIGGILDGVPPGIAISEELIQYDLDRRRPGKTAYVSARQEADTICILSGVVNKQTTGASIGFCINNENAHPGDYAPFFDAYRPGHADYTYQKKYGVRDPRGGGRASARETAIRVAAGAIAKAILWQTSQSTIRGYLSRIGTLCCESNFCWETVTNNPFSCPDQEKIAEIADLIAHLQKVGDSVGAEVTLIAENIPAGLGDPVFDKLSATLAHGLMSINAVKAVEIGDGTAVVRQRGSEHRDPLSPGGFLSNHAGGILGGISTGQDIITKISIKPTSSVAQPISTITTSGEPVTISVTGRHDPCIGIRTVPIAEAMVAIVLVDHLLRQKALLR